MGQSKNPLDGVEVEIPNGSPLADLFTRLMADALETDIESTQKILNI